MCSVRIYSIPQQKKKKQGKRKREKRGPRYLRATVNFVFNLVQLSWRIVIHIQSRKISFVCRDSCAVFIARFIKFTVLENGYI